MVIPRERRATPSGGFTGATGRAGAIFGHAALSLAYVERLHCASSALPGRKMASGRRMNEMATDPRATGRRLRRQVLNGLTLREAVTQPAQGFNTGVGTRLRQLAAQP